MKIVRLGQKLAILQVFCCLVFFSKVPLVVLIVFLLLAIGFWSIAFLVKKERLQAVLDQDAILESLVEGVLVLDAKMNIQHVNASASRSLGFSKRQLKGKRFPQKETSLLVQKARDLLETCHRLRFPATDIVVIDKGKKIHFDIIAIPRVCSLGFVLIFQDKSSDHKMLEMGKDFVSSSSHELRTPITIIRGFAETLQDTKDLPKEIEEEILEKIVRNCKRMETLIRNLLTLADVENIPLPNYQQCDLGDLLEECKRIVSTVYSSAHIHIKKEVEYLEIEVDPSLFELAIVNLLTNAAKYSQDPAEITVSFYQNMDEIVLSISDKGIGIPQEDVEHVFERFYTVNKAHSRKLGGAGLGLALVKTIIEKHDGIIQVESVQGVGSTFTMAFPISQRTCICK